MISRISNVLLVLSLILIAVPLKAEQTAPIERAIIVLDASGSMWGQIEGRSKIEIAREALEGLVKEWPEQRELGLVAYGHRRKGDCEDIELLVEPGKVDAGRIVEVSKAINPKGKTPLSASVKMAADALKFTEEKATVILLSDGIETCDLNPCDVGAELEELGIDFTAHVIGFDIKDATEQEGLRCLAENTGGKFIAADNAQELYAALSVAAEVEAEVEDEAPVIPEAPKARLEAPAEAVKGTVVKVTHFFEDEASAEEQKHLGYLYLHYPNVKKAFTYSLVNASKTGEPPVTEIRLPAEAGTYELLWKTRDSEVIAERTIEATEAEIAIKAPDTATGGATVTVELEAPAGLTGYVYLNRKGIDKSITYQRVNTTSTGEYQVPALRLPTVPGDYVLQWQDSRKQLLAERDLVIEEAKSTLSAPESVPVGTPIPLSISGSEGLSGYVYLRREGIDKHISYERIQTNARGEYEVRPLRAPATPGQYLLEWRTAKQEVLDSTTIEVVGVELTLAAPEEAFQGTEIAVDLEGPDGLSGYIHLRKKGVDKDATYDAIRQAATGGYQPTKLRLPIDVGTYVLSLKTRAGEELANREIELKKAEVELKVSSPLQLGQPIEVELSAPAGLSGYVYLHEQGNEKALTYTAVRSGSLENYQRVNFKAPEKTGVYELRWQSAKKELIAEAQVEVVKEPVAATEEEEEAAEASEGEQAGAEPAEDEGLEETAEEGEEEVAEPTQEEVAVEEEPAVETAEEESVAEPAENEDAAELAEEEPTEEELAEEEESPEPAEGADNASPAKEEGTSNAAVEDSVTESEDGVTESAEE